MDSIGKLFIFIGVLISLTGVILLLLSKTHIPLGRLPGDIFIQKKNFTFYFPLTTSIIVSVVLSIVFYFIFRFHR